MSDQSPPERVESGNNDGGGNGRNIGKGRNNRNRRKKTSQSTFKGGIDGLEDATYDITIGQDTFTSTTRCIAEYVSTQFPGASEYRNAMMNLELPELVQPPPPADINNVAAFKLWRIELRQYADRRRDRENASGRVFGAIMIQCSQALCNRMEAHARWTIINGSNDVIGLLLLIRGCITQGQTRQYEVHTRFAAEVRALTYKQDKYTSDNTYYDRFREYVADAERLGSMIGVSNERVETILEGLAEDPAIPTEAERALATSAAREEYYAVAFLLNSDPRRYGSLVRDIQNEYTRGTSSYPTTLSAAYDYLVNYQRAPARHSPGNENEMAFLQEGERAENTGGRGRGGGRNGTGRGRGGRGAISGRRNSQRGGSSNDSGGNEGDDAQYLIDNADDINDDVASYSPDVVLQVDSCLFTDSIKNDLLLDSCSTVCLISNQDMLHDIRTVNKVMRVQCNAGVRQTKQMGRLGEFPEPVWYNPNGVANILSLYVVQKYYRVSYDSQSSKDIMVHTKSGILRFAPKGRGLYTLRHARPTDGWALVTTMEDKLAGYTKRQYSQAKAARRLQNIAMFPSSADLASVIDNNTIQNLPITRADIAAADDIFGPNLGSLQGKTVRRNGPAVRGRADIIASDIKHRIGQVTLAIDIMFLNGLPFFVTISRGLQFGTVEYLKNKQASTISKCLRKVVGLYRSRGLRITTILGDNDFQPLNIDFPDIHFNLCSHDEHVPDIERFIRTVKNRTRSCYNTLPFHRIPRLVLKRMVGNAVFWLNSFPKPNGVSPTLSPRYIMLGRHLDASKHLRIEFGAYAQTHKKSQNDMQPRTTGAICLGPTGNEQGGHFFMSLATGKCLTRHQWTEMPMPADAIAQVSRLGANDKMPKTLTFTNRFGLDYPDHPDSVDDDHDSAYSPSDDDTSSVTSSYTYNTDNDDDDNDHPDPPSFQSGPAGVPSRAVISVISNENERYKNKSDNEDDIIDNNDDADNDIEVLEDDVGIENGEEDMEESGEEESTGEGEDEDDNDADTADAAISDSSVEENHPESITGVGDIDNNSVTITGVGENNNLAEQMDTKYGPRNHEHNLRPRRMRTYDHLHAYIASLCPDERMDDHQLSAYLFLTEQMSVKRGLKMFGKSGADAVVDELKQVHRMKALIPTPANQLTREQKRMALRYLMYLKQKRNGKIKARGCADGRPQRLYKSKHDVSSPTVTTESIFLTSLVDAYERRAVATVDVPGAFMHACIDEEIYMRLDGPMAELLVRVDPSTYKTSLTTENGRPVIYVRLAKALYGTLQAAYLFWKNLTSFLVDELGFTINPYDRCVANKIINRNQCTICWHVDDLKISHVDQEVVDEVITKLNQKYGSKEAPLTATRGMVHDYLGMTLDYSTQGRVIFKMDEYVQNLLDELPETFNGSAVTPATDRLFTVNPQAEKLSTRDAELFHKITAKLLYLCKRVRIDIQVAVAFLTTRVKSPDVDDWKKLQRVIRYLRAHPTLNLTLETNDCCQLHWWIDASFAVHTDKRSHTGLTMSMGKGSIISSSTRQKINTKSSTEAELVGVDDGMGLVCWSRNFLQAQGIKIQDNVVFQDNQSAILLERNGKASSGRRSRHIDIRYFFVTDKIQRKELRVEYCPTDEMLGDFFTKPLQGSKFRRMRQQVMNLESDELKGDSSEREGVSSNRSQECVGRSMKSPLSESEMNWYEPTEGQTGVEEWKTVIRRKHVSRAQRSAHGV